MRLCPFVFTWRQERHSPQESGSAVTSIQRKIRLLMEATRIRRTSLVLGSRDSSATAKKKIQLLLLHPYVCLFTRKLSHIHTVRFADRRSTSQSTDGKTSFASACVCLYVWNLCHQKWQHLSVWSSISHLEWVHSLRVSPHTEIQRNRTPCFRFPSHLPDLRSEERMGNRKFWTSSFPPSRKRRRLS